MHDAVGVPGDAVVVCHNAKFDIQFLDNEYRKLGRSVEYPNLIDTLLLAREMVARGSTAQVLSEENLHRARHLAEVQGDFQGAAICHDNARDAHDAAEHHHG